MRHTLKESILQGPVHFYVGLGRSYLCHLCALLSVLKARLFIVTMPCRLWSGYAVEHFVPLSEIARSLPAYHRE